MPRSIPISVAILLAVCGGAAVTTADNAADASQGSRRGKQTKQTRAPAEDPMIREARELEEAVQSGGMPGCIDPSLRGRERAVAERLGGVPCEQRADANQSSGGDWSGDYGELGPEGGVTVQIRARGGNRYHVELITISTATSCGGSISGVGSAAGNRLSISDTLSLGEYGNASCTMHLTRQGNRLSLEGEGDCHYWSGVSCGFGGTLRREGPTRR